jgi:hypothetical protein
MVGSHDALSGVVSGARLIGPLAVLSACVHSAVSSGIWSRNIGETSCRWRTAYNPDGRAFGIWSVIYTGTLLSVALQLLDIIPTVGWWASLLWSISWASCGVWVPLFDGEYPRALLSAAVAISVAAVTAVAASWVESSVGGSWSCPVRTATGDEGPLLGSCVAATWPLSLLAGWLLAAATLNIGIASLANSGVSENLACVKLPPRRPGETADQYRRRRRVAYREANALAPVERSVVPPVLMVGVLALSLAANDALLSLPLAWAIVNMSAWPSSEYVVAVVASVGVSAWMVLRAAQEF